MTLCLLLNMRVKVLDLSGFVEASEWTPPKVDPKIHHEQAKETQAEAVPTNLTATTPPPSLNITEHLLVDLKPAVCPGQTKNISGPEIISSRRLKIHQSAIQRL